MGALLIRKKGENSKTWLTGALLFGLLSFFFWWPARAQSMENAQKALWDELNKGFDHYLKVLAYGAYLDLADSTSNPGNRFLELPACQARGEARLDLRLVRRALELSAKPRAVLGWHEWREGGRTGEREWDTDFFLNEWLVRVSLLDSLFLSYGRENLQWGPSALISPSNPFFRDNGRDNPVSEVAGMDFARLVWLPWEGWSASLIANTSKGHQKPRFHEFEKTYAFKLDYTGREAYAGLILSHTSRDRDRLGAFTGWTATDALLVYGEGVVSKGSRALYPAEAATPFGMEMVERDRDASSLCGTLLLGGATTLGWGPTLTLEYIYNSPGYSDEEAGDYRNLRRRASDSLLGQGPLAAYAEGCLSRTADPNLMLLRQHYVMLQYVDTGIHDVLDLTFRWTQCLDDGAGQFLSIVEYYLGDHVKLFSIGSLRAGPNDRALGDVLKRQWMIGLEYTF